ncbi:MAG: endo alpha-1,4 polygalactosaminidase [Pararobbsia sp.]
MGRFARALVCVVSAWLALGRTALADTAEADPVEALHSIAFFYGRQPPLDALAHYDAAVIEADHGFRPPAATVPPSRPTWYAYVSVGEVNPSRAFFSEIPRGWLRGTNDAWQSSVVDQTAPGWPAFLVEKVVAPLWRQGYRGFFLDTLDSYQLVATTDAARAAQQAGLVAVVRTIHARFPGAYLILNRGFELLPAIHDIVDAVAFESLFRSWDQTRQHYVEVAPQDRDWLLGRARVVRDQYRLPLISIDYCDPADPACAVRTAASIRALGIVPWVADGGLQTMGIGNPAD